MGCLINKYNLSYEKQVLIFFPSFLLYPMLTGKAWTEEKSPVGVSKLQSIEFTHLNNMNTTASLHSHLPRPSISFRSHRLCSWCVNQHVTQMHNFTFIPQLLSFHLKLTYCCHGKETK